MNASPCVLSGELILIGLERLFVNSRPSLRLDIMQDYRNSEAGVGKNLNKDTRIIRAMLMQNSLIKHENFNEIFRT